MIHYVKGNLLDAPTQALVNTVNTVGVMGKGIALQFKETFPDNFRHYQKVCKAGGLEPGGLLLHQEISLNGPRIIVNFATKKEWFRNSQYEWIEKGLVELVHEIQARNIKSIAIPPLGSGNGGLDWERVKPMIEEHLTPLAGVEVLIYEPNDAVKQILQQQAPAQQATLTPARAMLLYAMFHYEALGESPNLFVANKLAWFLQRMGEPLRLNFTKHIYGPYTPQVGHVLYALNGKYVAGLEQNQARPFEDLQLRYEYLPEVEKYIQQHLTQEQQTRMNNLIHLMDGFQSSWSLEVLASVDYLLSQQPGQTTEDLFKGIQAWNTRKKRMVQPYQVEVAFKRLMDYQNNLSL